MSRTLTSQQLVNEFLQAELHHTIGAYGVAVVEFQRVLDEDRGYEEHEAAVLPSEALMNTTKLNQQLLAADPADRLVGARRLHPRPNCKFSDGGAAQSTLGLAIYEFYATAEKAIKEACGERRYKDDEGFPRHGINGRLGDEDALRLLGVRLGITHDPQRRGYVGGGQAEPVEAVDEATQEEWALKDEQRSRKGKLLRVRDRRDAAQEDLHGGVEPQTQRHVDRARHILRSSLTRAQLSSDTGLLSMPLHHLAIGALVEGHMRMHLVEHELSGSFEETLQQPGRYARPLQRHLRASIALQTFAYATARSAPWMFAEGEVERDHVLRHYRDSSDKLKPPICLWLASQVSMLALHRRGYSHWLAGDRPQAYRDYYKLKRLIRQVARSLETNVSRPPRHAEFLDGLYALAEHHTAEIYRDDHAHARSLRHFNSAAARLARLTPEASFGKPSGEGGGTPGLLHNSRWRVRLLIGQGKAYYELGRVKASLLSYVKAWKALLELIDTESRTQSNHATADELIEWLQLVVDDPEVNKALLRDRFAPLVEQFQTMANSGGFTDMAAEIMALIGHVFVVLKLPGENRRRDDSLARAVLSHAARLSFRRTILASDLLKLEHRRRSERQPSSDEQRPPEKPADERRVPDAPSITDHWPGGGGKFEEAARVIEYLLQTWLNADGDAEPGARSGDADGEIGEAPGHTHQKIAKDLLHSYLTHTDSSNVKLAEVYRYLMQDSTDVPGAERDDPSIDLVCARRYSSFFPFLPRPSAFNVRGGGYFVRVNDAQTIERARRLGVPHPEPKRGFGIVVDPGPDFLGNLYRCGFGLADIDMVVVTHDHADHIASLDALFALLQYRSTFGARRFRNRQEADGGLLLPVVGNESVVARYSFYNETLPGSDKPRSDAAVVMTFDELQECIENDGELGGADPGGTPSRILLPPSLRVKPIQSVKHTDGHGHLPMGFVLSAQREGRSASVGFTSDTGWPTDAEAAAWPDEADVVVAHVSGVPLHDMREMAGLDDRPDAAGTQTEPFQRLWLEASKHRDEDAAAQARKEFLLEQLQFGFRSRPNKPGDLSTSPLSPLGSIKATEHPDRHLYLWGLLALADRMKKRGPGLLVIGELREELGSFRTRIAAELNNELFQKFGDPPGASSALTADIGLRIRVASRDGAGAGRDDKIRVLCTTCDLDNDLTEAERLHPPARIHEVCVKGESEGMFYNCRHHDPQSQREPMWVELVERYDLFSQ